MIYATEDIIAALRGAREAKGLSQRALSARISMPQSHISKIESGGTDIRLSSLIELARALDLELRLVPRRAIAAIETVVRSTAPVAPTTSDRTDTAKALREFEKTLESVNEALALFPDQTTLRQVQDSLQFLQALQSAGRDFRAALTEARKACKSIQNQLPQVREAAKAAKTLPPETLRVLTKAADQFQRLRNQIVHGIPPAVLPRPVYRLDDNEENANG